jgi:probable HAF family extracellular repeat protein
MRTISKLLSALLVVSVTQNAWGQSQYSLTNLGVVPDALSSSGQVSALNNSGQVVGGNDFGSGVHAFLESGGTIQDLGTPSPSQSFSLALGINNAEQVVGISQQGNGTGLSYPFIYSGGTMTVIPGLFGGGYGTARGINNLGQAVGISGEPNGQIHAFLYSGGTTTDLLTLTGTAGYSDAYSINDHTQVVGDSIAASGIDRAVLWQNGTLTDLGDLYGGTGGARAYAINNVGQAVGESWAIPSLVSHAYLWQNGAMADLGVLPGTNDSLAQGINDSGKVVGTSYNPNGTHLPFVWNSTDGMRDLNTLLDSTGAGWTLEEAYCINDSGQILGTGINPGGQTDAFLLTPVPEPSALALLCVGAIGLLGYKLRHKWSRHPSNDCFRRLARARKERGTITWTS